MSSRRFNFKSLKLEDMKYIFSDSNLPVEPLWHQYVSLSLSVDRNRIGFFHDVGTGKTILSLLVNYIWNKKRILVVTPTSAFGAWERDLKHFDFSYQFLVGSGKKRKELVKEDKNIHIINYEGLKSIFANFVPKIRRGRDLGSKEWVVDRTKFNLGFDSLVLDEVHRCIDYKSIQSDICMKLSLLVNNTIGMTGTPVDRNLLDVFNIMKVIDHGESLGSNFFAYRNQFFYQNGPYEWKEKDGAEERILERMSHNVLSFSQEECFDLPETTFIVLPIKATSEFRNIQKNLIKNKKLELSNGQVTISKSNMKNTAHVLCQLTGGFVYVTQDGERSSYRLRSNPKVDALLEMYEDRREKIIVFYEYDEEGDIIAEALNKKKILYNRACGKTNVIEQANLFQNDPKYMFLLAQKSCAQEGYDATSARIVVFFSPISSPKIRKQCIGRVKRKGQTRKTIVYDFCLEGSVDGKKLANKNKRTTFVEDVMEFLRENGGM